MSSVESILEKDSINNDLDKTLVNTVVECKTKPIDIVALNNNSNDETIKPDYREFDSNAKDNAIDTTGDNKKEEINILDVSTERSSILYDVLHILDDVYSYGRTVIENNYFNFADNADFNLVYPNIYIGNYSTSTNLELLQSVGITHILSVIPTFNPPFPEKFKYLHIPAYDDTTQDIKQYFAKTNTFISDVLLEGGKILIHCMVGRSRSVSIFLAFLINIIHGGFNQSIVRLDADNDVSNEVEYKQYCNSRNLNNTGIKDFVSTTTATTNANNDIVSTLEYQKPALSNKYKSFMLYKKETMINEVEELISKYNLLQKELNIFVSSGSSDSSSSSNDMDYVRTYNQLKQQFSNNLIVQIIKYVKKYRISAYPNPYFVEQLVDIIML